MIKRKFSWIIQSLIMSFFMGVFMSLVMTIVNVGIVDGILFIWIKACLIGVLIAIPTGLIFGPVSKKISESITN